MVGSVRAREPEITIAPGWICSEEDSVEASIAPVSSFLPKLRKLRLRTGVERPDEEEFLERYSIDDMISMARTGIDWLSREDFSNHQDGRGAKETGSGRSTYCLSGNCWSRRSRRRVHVRCLTS